MTLDDLDIDPAMFETHELRTIFRLARERIAELRQLISELEDTLDPIALRWQEAGTAYAKRITELESEAVEVLELHESTVAHVGRLEAANTELATTNAHLAAEVRTLREAYE